MKKTLTALALTIVAGSMIACGGEATNTNNANNMNKPAANTNSTPMAPANTNTMAPAANTNSGAMAPANTNGGMANKNEMKKEEPKKEEGKNEKKAETKKP